MQTSQIKLPWTTLMIFGVAAFLGALIASYAYHRFNIWIAGGQWCTQFTPSGRVERHYGSMCDVSE